VQNGGVILIEELADPRQRPIGVLVDLPVEFLASLDQRLMSAIRNQFFYRVSRAFHRIPYDLFHDETVTDDAVIGLCVPLEQMFQLDPLFSVFCGSLLFFAGLAFFALPLFLQQYEFVSGLLEAGKPLPMLLLELLPYVHHLQFFVAY